MFDDLLQLIRNNGQESVIHNNEVPNEHNESVLQAAGGSIMDTIKGMLANGQGDQIAQMAENPGHPAAQQMQDGFASQIMRQFGINGEAAKNIAGTLLPSVLGQLTKGNGVAPGGINLSSISSMLGKAGLDKDGDGDVDLRDVTKMFGF